MSLRRRLLTLGLGSWLAGIATFAACGGEGLSTFDESAGDASLGGDGSGGGVDPMFADGGNWLDGTTAGDGGYVPCGAGCATGTRCKYEVCVPDLGSCQTSGDCPGDSYCDTDNTCVPYGVPADKINDPTCARPIDPGVVTPTVQCEWEGITAAQADAGDPTAAYVNVYTAPFVADLNLDGDPNKLQPSVVMTTWASVSGERIGMLRVFDGRTCQEQMRIGGPDDPDANLNRPGYGTQWAIGDLDGDVNQGMGHPEIVGLHRTSGAFGTNPPLSVIAFRVNTQGATPKLERAWTGRICSGDGGADTPVTFGDNKNNYGPSIFDLDDDGVPEVVVDSMVFDNKGCLLNAPAAYTPYLDHGVMTTVADVDLDGKPDLVRYDGVFGWNGASKKWEMKSYFVPNANQKPGHLAVADLGAYSAIPGHPATEPLPEVIIASAATSSYNPNSSGTIRVQTLTGQIVFGPIPLYKLTQPHGGHGGPPTAGDFDGDGQIEFAAAANEFFSVYDPDCTGVGDGGVAQRPGGTCTRNSTPDGGTPLPNGILWAQPSSDYSSSETGSSLFDFNGDGKSEAVYRDECYLRVYEGATGNVIYSAPASSGTGQEYPIICDVDGDFATEIVVARATNSPTCPSPDPLFAGSGGFTKKGGFVILRDPMDRWAASRPIWNQHAYSITNVSDDGRIPRSSQWKQNWTVVGLNNFRQNTQGELGKLALADLTAQILNLNELCAGQSGNLNLRTRICNRGTNPVQDGVKIAFRTTPKGQPLDGGAATEVCTTNTPSLLVPGQCTDVSCTGFIAANTDVYVVVDPDDQVADCHPHNNATASARVHCPTIR